MLQRDIPAFQRCGVGGMGTLCTYCWEYGPARWLCSSLADMPMRVKEALRYIFEFNGGAFCGSPATQQEDTRDQSCKNFLLCTCILVLVGIACCT